MQALLFEQWPSQTLARPGRSARTWCSTVPGYGRGLRLKMTLAQVAVVARRIAASAGLAVPSVVLDAESRFPEIRKELKVKRKINRDRDWGSR